VTHSKATRKKADADPEKIPIKMQMKIHLSRRAVIFLVFSTFIGGKEQIFFAKVL
jgi:hypothetical protein